VQVRTIRHKGLPNGGRCSDSNIDNLFSCCAGSCVSKIRWEVNLTAGLAPGEKSFGHRLQFGWQGGNWSLWGPERFFSIVAVEITDFHQKKKFSTKNTQKIYPVRYLLLSNRDHQKPIHFPLKSTIYNNSKSLSSS
jgi:hypothetical protein